MGTARNRRRRFLDLLPGTTTDFFGSASGSPPPLPLPVVAVPVVVPFDPLGLFRMEYCCAVLITLKNSQYSMNAAGNDLNIKANIIGMAHAIIFCCSA